ncbi:MAG TPA: P-II family nitrogen regulator [Clostridiaceae bacterium]|nr:P-II family nitrogen regulator [Clostridiaceae bacterium]
MQSSNNNDYLLFCVIVNYGKGSKILKFSRQLGVTGGTLFLGKGTVKSSLLDILGINEIRKEILIMAIKEEMDGYLHKELTRAFNLDKPNHGIAFSMPIRKIYGSHKAENVDKHNVGGSENMDTTKYEAIFTIVDKGLADNVVEAATSVGSTGGTVIHGRGAGAHEKAKLFNIEIEPEKDIVLILSEAEKTDIIINAIREKLNIDKPGAGILFVMDVNRATGIFKG